MDLHHQYEMLEEDDDLRDALLSDGSAKDILLHLKPQLSLGVHQRINNKIDRDGNMHGMSDIMDAVRSFNCMPLFLTALHKTNQAHLARKINPQSQPPTSIFVNKSDQQQQMPQSQQHQHQPQQSMADFEYSARLPVDHKLAANRSSGQMYATNHNLGVSVQGYPGDAAIGMHQQQHQQQSTQLQGSRSVAREADLLAHQQPQYVSNDIRMGGMVSTAAPVDLAIHNEPNPTPRRPGIGEPIREYTEYGDDDFWVDAEV